MIAISVIFDYAGDPAVFFDSESDLSWILAREYPKKQVTVRVIYTYPLLEHVIRGYRCHRYHRWKFSDGG